MSPCERSSGGRGGRSNDSDRTTAPKHTHLCTSLETPGAPRDDDDDDESITPIQPQYARFPTPSPGRVCKYEGLGSFSSSSCTSSCCNSNSESRLKSLNGREEEEEEERPFGCFKNLSEDNLERLLLSDAAAAAASPRESCGWQSDEEEIGRLHRLVVSLDSEVEFLRGELRRLTTAANNPSAATSDSGGGQCRRPMGDGESDSRFTPTPYYGRGAVVRAAESEPVSSLTKPLTPPTPPQTVRAPPRPQHKKGSGSGSGSGLWSYLSPVAWSSWWGGARSAPATRTLHISSNCFFFFAIGDGVIEVK